MYKLKLYLKPKTEQYLYNRPFGYVFRGYLMNWLKELAPKKVHELHDYNSIRPYSINSFYKRKEHLLELTFIAFKSDLGELLYNDIIDNNKFIIKLRDNIFNINNIEYGPIDLKKVFEQAKPVQKFSIYFPKPTYFNTSKGDYPIRIPIPTIIFSNLSTLWNSVSKQKQNINENHFVKWLETHMYLSGHKIQTIPLTIGKDVPVVGFKGHTSFIIKELNYDFYEERTIKAAQEDFLSNCIWTDFLCKLAEYTNVGVNRTAGFGIVNYYPESYF